MNIYIYILYKYTYTYIQDESEFLPFYKSPSMWKDLILE